MRAPPTHTHHARARARAHTCSTELMKHVAPRLYMPRKPCHARVIGGTSPATTASARPVLLPPITPSIDADTSLSTDATEVLLSITTSAGTEPGAQSVAQLQPRGWYVWGGGWGWVRDAVCTENQEQRAREGKRVRHTPLESADGLTW